MGPLDIFLLGHPQIMRDGAPVLDSSHAKAFALVAYLALAGPERQSRATVAGLLWPDQTEELARHSLRQALSFLRRRVDADAVVPLLEIRREFIAFDPAAARRVDVREVMDLLDACDRHDHGEIDRCQACLRRLSTLESLYTGPLLDGFRTPDSDLFSTWVEARRHHLQERVLGALDILVHAYARQEDRERAKRIAKRQLELDPFRETSQRDLMRLEWESGQRAIALRHFDAFQQRLAEDIGVDPEPETLDLVARIRADTAPARGTAGPADAPSRLPTPLTRFVGRERDLDAVAELLARDGCRLLTITGPGGTGKTRLALEAARQHARMTGDITCFVPLVSVRDPAQIPLAIAHALEINLPPTVAAADQVMDWLRNRRVFLVLDNLEHLLADIHLIPELLAASPGLTLLVTSRERLQLSSEWVYELEGLLVPRDAHADSFAGYDAVDLLGERLRQVRSGVAIRPEERPAVIEICQLVEGLPLAIELAVAQAAHTPLAEIARGIRRNIDVLSGGLRDFPDRHQSLRAVFLSSWTTLHPSEQDTLCRLSIFRNEFHLETAAAVANAPPSAIANLVLKSLVSRRSSGRYALHPAIAQFCAEILGRDIDAWHATRDRHSRWFLSHLADIAPMLTSVAQNATLREIDDSRADILAAWTWALDHGMIDELQAAVDSCWLCFVLRGRMREGAETFGATLAVLDHEVSAPDADARLASFHAWIRIFTGGFLSGVGRYDDAVTLLSAGLAYARAHAAGRMRGLALNQLAAALTMQGRIDAAIGLLHESLEAFERAGDEWGMAFALNDLGFHSAITYGDSAGREHCERARNIFRQLGDRRGQALATHNLGDIAMRQGELHRALRLHRAALSLRQQNEDRWGEAASLLRLGQVSRLMGRDREARGYLLRALAIAWDTSLAPALLQAAVELIALETNVTAPDQAGSLLTAALHHPALPGEARERIRTLMQDRDLPPAPVAAGPSLDTWAIAAIEDYARSLLAASPGAR